MLLGHGLAFQLKGVKKEGANHGWCCDFVSGRMYDGRKVRMLTLIEESTQACLAIRVARRLGSHEVIDVPAAVMLHREFPEHIRADNGPEFMAKELR